VAASSLGCATSRFWLSLQNVRFHDNNVVEAIGQHPGCQKTCHPGPNNDRLMAAIIDSDSVARRHG